MPNSSRPNNALAARVWGGSVGVDEGLVGADGGEYRVGVLVGVGYVSVAPCSGVYVSAAEGDHVGEPGGGVRLWRRCIP